MGYKHILPSDYLASLSISDRAERWERIIQTGESATLVAEIEGQVFGFVNYGRCRDTGASSDRAEIWAIYVAPYAWRRGIGRQLMRQALAELTSQGYRETSLWALSANELGRSFYASEGFATVTESAKQLEIDGTLVSEMLYLYRNAA